VRFLLIMGVSLIIAGCLHADSGERNVAERLEMSTSDVSASIAGSRSGMNGPQCYPAIRGVRYRVLVVDPGPVTLGVSCRQYDFDGAEPRPAVKSAFDADEAHDYALLGYDNSCTGSGRSSALDYDHLALVDRTTGNRVISRCRLRSDIEYRNNLIYGTPYSDLPGTCDLQ